MSWDVSIVNYGGSDHLRICERGDEDAAAVVEGWEETQALIKSLREAATAMWGEEPKVWTLDEVRAAAKELDA